MYERGMPGQRGADYSSPRPFRMFCGTFWLPGWSRSWRSTFGFAPEFISPYQQEDFGSQTGRKYPNHFMPAVPGPWAVPTIEGMSFWIGRSRVSIYTGFSIEYPDASLLTIGLSERRSLQWPIAKALTILAPRGSGRRRWLRELYAAYRPSRAKVRAVFDQAQPAFVLVAARPSLAGSHRSR